MPRSKNHRAKDLGISMIIRLPKPLYHVFPLLCVVAGFSMAALVTNPIGVSIAVGLYIYAFRILWLRLPLDE